MSMQPQRLDRLQINRLFSVRELDLTLRPLNVVIGANGSGKSNLLEVFDLLGSIHGRRLRAYVARAGGADRLLHWGQRRSPSATIRATFGANGYEAVLSPDDTGGVYFDTEECWGQGAGHARPFDLPLGVGHTESALPAEVRSHLGGVADWTLTSLAAWRRFHFHDTSRAAGVKQPQPLTDMRELQRDGSNLGPYLWALAQRDRPAYERIRGAVQQVAPFFDDWVLRPELLNPDTLRLMWRHTDGEGTWGPESLSDGTMRFMCLATLLLQPSPPSLLIVDEPELGLHPAAIVQLGDLLRSAATQSQVIVATQSVTLLNQLDLEDVIVAERHDGASSFEHIVAADLDAWLDDFALGELWEKNIIGGRPSWT